MLHLENDPVQCVAIIVDDIDKYSAAWAKVFAVDKPKVITTDAPGIAQTKYEGRPSNAGAKMAFLFARNIWIKLIEPIGPDSVWAEFLRTHGPGVHHISWEVDDLEQTIGQLGLKQA